MKIHTVDGLPILLHRHHAPFTNVSVRVRVGSAHESLKQYGLAHALEHMMFKGTPTRGEMQIDRDIERLGAANNAGTNYHHTFYWVDSRNENWEAGLEILADLFLNSTLPAYGWDKEKDVILSEYRRGQDDPRSSFWRTTMKAVFGDLMHDIIGTEESIRSFEIEDLQLFKQRWYGKPNVYILAVGDVDEDDPSLIASYFKDMQEAEHKDDQNVLMSQLTPLKPATGTRWKSRPNLQEARLIALQDAEPYGSDRWIHDEMVTDMLGGSTSALLFERIRKELGMSCYGLFTMHVNTPLYSSKIIEGGIDPEQMDRLEDEIRKILNDFPSLVTEDRFVIAREQMLTAMSRGEENVASFAGAISHFYELGAEDPVDERRAFIDKLKGIPYREIVDYANIVFTDKSWHWSHLLPE